MTDDCVLASTGESLVVDASSAHAVHGESLGCFQSIPLNLARSIADQLECVKTFSGSDQTVSPHGVADWPT